MNLPDLYNRVTAKRPELAVKDLTPPIPGVRSYLLLPNFLADDTDGDSISAALILAKWVEALPDGSNLMVRGNIPSDRRWTVYPSFPELDYYHTPLEALAAFYLGDSQ